jgi:hypothetical protein
VNPAEERLHPSEAGQADDAGVDDKAGDKPLPAAARRALAEAAARREAMTPSGSAAEVGGRQGPDPVRYGDWEVKGIATDF